MSYSIFYRNLAIKMPNNEFIFVVEAGSNNCYDAHSKRRSRDWQSLNTVNPKVTPVSLPAVHQKFYEDCETAIAKWGEEKYTEKNFGWLEGLAIGSKHTSSTTLSDVKNFFRKAAKNARAIEEYYAEGVVFTIRTTHYPDNKDFIPKGQVIASTGRLVELINEYREYCGDEHFYISTNNITQYIWLRLFPKKEKKVSVGDYVINVHGYGQFQRLGGRRIFFGENGKRFTEKGAKKMIEKLNQRSLFEFFLCKA